MDSPVFFGDVVAKAAAIVSNASLPAVLGSPLLIRDVYGLVSIALNVKRSEHQGTVSKLEAEAAKLGVYAASPSVVCVDDFFDAEQVFNDPSIIQLAVPGTELLVHILERQITGQDWLAGGGDGGATPTESVAQRLVFFGLKGGVGRSTALAVLAYQLARAGKQVLLIDLDLESPGLSGLLLPPERLADFGVVDWLVEDAVGQGPEVARRMVAASPLSENLRDEIRVAAAIGNGDRYYLDKLSRVYADVSVENRQQRFSQRVKRLVRTLEEQEKPDVVLIDSRAGIHDLAAVSIVELASTAFLFATDAAAGWQGYRLLFSHWQSRPSVARSVRERLKMVSALFPEADQSIRAKRFLERSYTLFADTLYDEVDAGGSHREDQDLFNFDVDDTSSPHYPLRIKWNARFQEFDPLQIPRGLFSDDEIRSAYGEFLDGAMQLLRGAQPNE
ncbi:MAG TPA: AAA family ATPase [Bryobacteraceae bacterium]|nr:AAA family ATPase [Bryobacteraceae bacterium]